MKNKKYTDVLGGEIRPGDWIVYGSLKGRCAGLNIGRVIEWEVVESQWATQASSLRIKADAVLYTWGEYRRAGMTTWGKNKKRPTPVRLDYSDRICVIPESIVPDHIKALLA